MIRFVKRVLSTSNKGPLGVCCFSNSSEDKRIEKFLVENSARISELSPTGQRDDLKQRLAPIFSAYDYQVYKKSVDLLSTFSNPFLAEKKLQLENHEICDILRATDERTRDRIISYFVNSKVKLVANKLEKKNSKIAEKGAMLQTGIWNGDEQSLLYGLWHNNLFTKFKRSDHSRLSERRLHRPIELRDTPRVIVDLEFVNKFEYFQVRTLALQIRNLLAFNKYLTYHPLRLEFVTGQSEFSSQFSEIFTRSVPGWNTPEFGYNVQHNHSLKSLVDSGKTLYGICPSARRAITESEVLNSDSVFVLPGLASRSMRDPMFAQIKQHFSKNGVNVRRLPAVENVVWKKFHGVIELNNTFAILHDALHRQDFNWLNSFQRHMVNDKIMSEQEMQQLADSRRKIRDSRNRTLVGSASHHNKRRW